MNNDLPISITTSAILSKSFAKINSVAVKHEAHFNFQTLAAGWYEDENDILAIELKLIAPHELEKQLNVDDLGIKTNIADDVLSYFDQTDNKVMCFIAITDAEEILLIQQPKLLSNYIKTKLLKVMNRLAQKHAKVSLI
jgi:hypothetical protein